MVAAGTPSGSPGPVTRRAAAAASAAAAVAAAPRSQAAVGSSHHSIEQIPLIGRNPAEEDIYSPIDRRSEVYRTIAFEHVRERGPPTAASPGLWSVPNLLTYLRLLLVPVVAWGGLSTHPHAPLLTAVLFVVASLTDWLDGYLARRWEIATAFGAFLDPVADKVMVTTVLVLLAASPPPPISSGAMAVPVCVICCREVTMSALREWAATAGGAAHGAVKVNSYGKWKTALQMTSMSLLLFCKDGTGAFAQLFDVVSLTRAHVTIASWGLLWAAAGLALLSLSIYLSNIWAHFVAPVQAATAPRRQAQRR